MSDLAKLKKKAADLEQRRQFDKALAVYEEMLLAQEGSDDADVSLLNRVGDLRLRIGRPGEALDAYERAVDLYVERGFLNNAIALCNKILRQDPARADVHYRLGRISAEKGFRSDAKRHFLEYAGLMQSGGRLDEAFTALSEFADLSPDHTDVRLMLAEQLARHDRAEEAVAQLTTVLDRFEAERRFAEADEIAERIRQLDPSFAAPAHAEFDAADLGPAGGPAQRRGTPARGTNGMPDLVLIDPGEALAAQSAYPGRPELTVERVEQLEITDLAGPDLARDASGDGLGPDAVALDGFQSTGLADVADAAGPDADAPIALEGLDHFEPTALDAPALEPLDLQLDAAGAHDRTEEPDDAPDGGSQPALDDRFEMGLEDVAGAEPVDAAASAPVAEPFDAVDAAFLSYEDEEIVVDEPVAPAAGIEALDGDDLVDEDAPDPLLDAVMLAEPPVADERGDAPGAADELALPALEMPPVDLTGADLVIEHPVDDLVTFEDAPLQAEPPLPLEPTAGLSAAGAAEPAPSAPRALDDDSFINLGDLLRSEDGPRSTRMVTEEKAPTGDEQADFAEMLRKFKQGVAENVDDGDFESHHDLGVAYKEMGLLDEAVAAFQRALRGTPHRARTYEALGHCFLEREQYAVASGVLQRALSEPGADDQQLVGVLYLLGRAAEAMNQREEALSYYQRVFAVDIEFADVAERMESTVQVAR